MHLTDADLTFSSDMCLLRYLRARDYDLVKAARMLRNTILWRRTDAIVNLSCDNPFMDELCREGKMYLNGYDKTGARLVVPSCLTF